MFKFSGKRPRDLGVANGKFTAAPTWKPNWVSSQVDPKDRHYIRPLPGAGDPKAVIARVGRVVESMPRTLIVRREPDYLHAEFSTLTMRFVDDVEFFADGQQLHVRSSSRLGISDRGVNRRRVEAIRKALS